MNWLFLNVEVSEQPASIRELITGSNFASYELSGGNKVEVIYDTRLNQKPIATEGKSKLIVVGWFILDGKLNDHTALLNKVQKVGLNKALFSITQGIFCGAYDDGTSVKTFVDWFGLSAHYVHRNSGILRMAPSAIALASSEDDLDSVNWSILQKKGHIWGSRTRYNHVYRCLPGSIHNANGYETYVDYSCIPGIPRADIAEQIRNTVDLFEHTQKFVSLSAGFDSRLLALIGDASHAYTWGPEKSKDIKNSTVIAKHLDIPAYHFRFKETPPTEDDRVVCDWLLSGQNSSHQPQFYTNYRKAANQVAPAFVSLDGYLGDVLQRGVYLYGSSVRSEIKRLVPSLFSRDTGEQILLERYGVLSPEEHEILLKDYRALLKSLQLTGVPQANGVTAFEFMFGRGFAHIYMGGVAMNGVHNVVVPGFADRRIFVTCVRTPVREVLNYTLFKQVWTFLNSDIVKLASEGLYSPKTPRILIPMMNLMGRVITNYLPMYKNYGKE